MEISGDKRAIEIYNGTGMSVSLDGNLIRLVRNGNDFDFSCTKAADLYQLDDDIGYEETYRIISHAGGNQNPDQVPSNVVQASASASFIKPLPMQSV